MMRRMTRWDEGMRPYTPADREHAHAVLRHLLRAGDVPFTVHPGDWDWWDGHADPRVPAAERLVGDDAVVHLGADGELTSMGLPTQRWELLPDAVVTVGWVSSRDGEACAALRRGGFHPAERGFALFERAVPDVAQAQRRVPALVPDGYVVRRLAGAGEAGSRADAARLAFGSTMKQQEHRARYASFMASPGYAWACDTVAVAEADGEIAAFAVTWPDAESSLGLFEPVGTHPQHQRRGLARAVVAAGLLDLARAGIARARVCSETDKPASMALYAACGFRHVDTLTWWHR